MTPNDIKTKDTQTKWTLIINGIKIYGSKETWITIREGVKGHWTVMLKGVSVSVSRPIVKIITRNQEPLERRPLYERSGRRVGSTTHKRNEDQILGTTNLEYLQNTISKQKRKKQTNKTKPNKQKKNPAKGVKQTHIGNIQNSAILSLCLTTVATSVGYGRGQT